MKLLIATPYFYPKIGGLESYAYNIAKGLQNRFHWKIVIITSNHGGRKDTKENVAGMTVYRLAPLFKISNTPINPFWFLKVREIISKEKPNIINAHAPVPVMADIAAFVSGNIPFVLTYHAGSMKKGKLFFDFLISIYEKLFLSHLFKRSNVIICSSEFVKKSLVEKYKVKNIVVTPAVDTKIFKPSKGKRFNDVLFVGRHANVYPLKGLNDILTAMQKMPKVKLTIVGEKIKNRQKNVRFIGIKTGKELAKEMQKSKVLVLPSIAPMESFGMVLTEAMACKTPVIGTQMGGIPEVIKQNKNGLLVPIKSPEKLKDAIESIVDNPALAKKMGQYGFNDVKKSFLWESKVVQTNKLLQNLL